MGKRICLVCGKMLPEGSAYCAYCGNKVGTAPQVPADHSYGGALPYYPASAPEVKETDPSKLGMKIALIVGCCLIAVTLIFGVIFGLLLWSESQSTVSGGSGKSASASVKLSDTEITLQVGQKHTLDYTYKSSKDPESVDWATSDRSVAKVTDGRVEAVGAGTCTITVNVDGKTATCEITVEPPQEEKQILGEWYLDEIWDPETDESLFAEEMDLYLTLSFLPDGTVVAAYDREETTFTWHFDYKDEEGDYWYEVRESARSSYDVAYIVEYDYIMMFDDTYCFIFYRVESNAV